MRKLGDGGKGTLDAFGRLDPVDQVAVLTGKIIRADPFGAFVDWESLVNTVDGSKRRCRPSRLAATLITGVLVAKIPSDVTNLALRLLVEGTVNP